MKVMVLVKATQDSEAGVMPSEQLLTDMGNMTLVKAGILLAAEATSQLKEARVRFSGTHRNGWTVHRDKELVAGFWICSRVKSMEEAITWVKRCEPNARRIRDSSDLYRRFRRSVDARTQRTGRTPRAA